MLFLILSILIQIELVFFAYCFCRRDILAPGFIIQIGVFLSFLGALIIYNIVDAVLSDIALIIIILGSFSSLIGLVLCELFVVKIYPQQERIKGGCKCISVVAKKKWLMLLLSIITVVILGREIVRIATIGGHLGGWNSLIGTYREVMISSYNFENSINSIISQLTKFCGAFAFIGVYILANNFVYKQYNSDYFFIKNNWHYIACVLLNVSMFILQSARMGIIRLFVAFLFFLLMVSREQGIKIGFWSAIKKSWKIISLLMVVFFSIRGLIGRKSKLPFVKYIAYYFGGSVISFQIIIKNSDKHVRLWGQETFAGVYSFLTRIGLAENRSRALRGVRLNGTLNDNVYTAFRRYYYDFGIWGVVILSLIVAFVGQLIYLRLLSKKNGDNLFLLLVFGSFYYVFIMQGIDDLAFSSIISTTGLVNIVYMFILQKWIFKEIRGR